MQDIGRKQDTQLNREHFSLRSRDLPVESPGRLSVCWKSNVFYREGGKKRRDVYRNAYSSLPDEHPKTTPSFFPTG
jgi:hypothetical protein